MTSTESTPVSLPRVAITFCTQCRWMLRAAYFGQELLSTFGTQIGEIALIPATGGLFTVELTYAPPIENEDSEERIRKVLIWDRKVEGGFPETKVLKQLVRDRIDPKKDLGHSDRGGKRKEEPEEKKDGADSATKATKDPSTVSKESSDGTVCEDCR
ncbi:seleno protein W family protein [Aaosphaeria arxii CBS 175.79]|uniref:Seleno protein W family protein n=1 Tax=Aaosphaeria arxii CBS 175.79 TaxID=1450172 RepID=A0A6A5Y8K5_9PLEO|nr:seleno protein W family protein [Aaosphaeria arxii CBS 175.79]KAF2021738.1 seleno protein W family protein [Aaosphaeria arxii CBS 175.79]